MAQNGIPSCGRIPITPRRVRAAAAAAAAAAVAGRAHLCVSVDYTLHSLGCVLFMYN